MTKVYFALLINLNVKGRGKLQKFERGREQKSLGSPALNHDQRLNDFITLRRGLMQHQNRFQ